MFVIVYNEGFVFGNPSTALKLVDHLVERHLKSPGTTYVLEFYDLAHLEYFLTHVAQKRISPHEVSLTVRGKRVTIEEDGSTPSWEPPVRTTSTTLTGACDASDTL